MELGLEHCTGGDAPPVAVGGKHGAEQGKQGKGNEGWDCSLEEHHGVGVSSLSVERVIYEEQRRVSFTSDGGLLGGQRPDRDEEGQDDGLDGVGVLLSERGQEELSNEQASSALDQHAVRDLGSGTGDHPEERNDRENEGEKAETDARRAPEPPIGPKDLDASTGARCGRRELSTNCRGDSEENEQEQSGVEQGGVVGDGNGKVAVHL